MPDISSRDDLERLLRGFYERALADPFLRHVFVDVVGMDLEAHLPRVTDFWQRVLFRTGAYDGRPMEVHQRVHGRVPLTGEHFARWLELWRETVSAQFAGPMADQAVAHANRMASGFLRNLTETAHVPRTLTLVNSGGGDAH
jgi:hemoglobin